MRILYLGPVTVTETYNTGVRTVRPSMALSISTYILYILKYGGPPADGGHPGGRRTGGHPGGRRTGGRYTAPRMGVLYIRILHQWPRLGFDPQLFYTYFYNHAHHPRLETDFKNHFWIQMAVLLLKPPNGVFRSETAVTRRFWK
jgi:hypothetical protein